MNQRRAPASHLFQTAALLLVFLGLTLGAISAQTQEAVTLLNFNHVWKYDQSGLELGTAWRTNDFDDSSWASGPGLLGFENSVPFPYPLSVRTPLIVSSTITSYYFRTTFQFSGPTNDLTLIASNFVDDGCVIYLNGLEAGRVRITNGYNAATYAQPFGISSEGQIDPVIITNLSLLRQGENCLAVEVHQFLAASSDVVLGTKLVLVPPAAPPDPPKPPVIISQPESQTVLLNAPFSFSVSATGDSLRYQWQKDEANIDDGTTATYTFGAAALASAGAYRVIVTNITGSVTSSVATLTVASDLVGPKMTSATVSNALNATLIFVGWTEILAAVPARDTRNFVLTRKETGEIVSLTRVLYSTSLGSGVQIDTTDPDWLIGDKYILTVNNVQDIWGNTVAPGSQIAISWPAINALIGSDHLWSFHNSASLEPDVADHDWFATNYVESAFWSSGRGIFYADAQYTPCFSTLQTRITHQTEPTLFRTTFERPPDIGSAARLTLRFIVDDGAVFYLNGQEFYRTNMAPKGWPLDSSSRALADRLIETCTPITLPVASLLPGTNWLAVAVYESHGTNDGRVFFGAELTLTLPLVPALPAEPSPTLRTTRLPDPDNRLVLDWTGHGFALESTATFSNNLSYPLGPWIQVTNMANPYTNSAADAARFFRLKK